MKNLAHRLLTILVLSALIAVSAPAWPQQTTIPDYDTARELFFWRFFYVFGGETLYCGQRFEPGALRAVNDELLSIEHAYPADWIAEAMGCENRDDCEAPGYGFREADLHNLWPALRRINSSRGDQAFDEIPGEDRRRFTDICPDYERTSGQDAVVEPRDSVKDDIARSLLYMNSTYTLPLTGMEPMLRQWHQEDPPDETERWRNYVIERLQGTRNPFIDNP